MTCFATAWTRRPEIELLLEADERIIDLGLGLDALRDRIGGGLEDGARLHFGDLGYLIAERQPRKQSIGLNSCSSCTRAHDLLDWNAELLGEVLLLPAAFGRNSCSGGSRKRIVCPENPLSVFFGKKDWAEGG